MRYKQIGARVSEEIAGQIRARAEVALDLAGQGITDEMRGNMYHCLDLIAANMRGICEEGLMNE